MKTIKKRLFVTTLLLLSVFLLSGCMDFFNTKPDPKIEGIDTKEEALDFIKTSAKTWNIIKVNAKISIIPLPMEGHIDLTNKKVYIEEYTKDENQIKTINQYLYFTDGILYSCTYSDGNIPTYDITTINEEFNYNVDINQLFTYLDSTELDISKLTFSKTEYQLKLEFSFSDGSKTYNVDLIYRDESIQLVVDDTATITFKKGESDFFTNLNLDMTPFENLK